MNDVEYYKLLNDNYKIYFIVNETCKDASQTIYTIGQCNHSKSIIDSNNSFAFGIAVFMVILIVLLIIKIIMLKLAGEM